VQAVFVQQKNRAYHSRTVSFDQAGDSSENFVQGCAEKDLQRIEHRIAGQGSREDADVGSFSRWVAR
jgi:hypothetical protein